MKRCVCSLALLLLMAAAVTCPALAAESVVGYEVPRKAAAVTVRSATGMFLQQGKDANPAALELLDIGQWVEIEFAGPVAASYPVQAEARRVLILERPPQPSDADRAGQTRAGRSTFFLYIIQGSGYKDSLWKASSSNG
jgi:hypothetical protein